MRDRFRDFCRHLPLGCAGVAALVLLFFCARCRAAEPTVTPVPRTDPAKWNELKAAPGRLLVLVAEPASKWLLVDEDCDLVAFDAGKHGAFCAVKAGRYRLIVTAPDGTSARVVVVVGDAPPDPNPPKPPADPLKAKLRAAYDADTAPIAQKHEHAKDLAALYEQAAKLAADPSVLTAGDLLARVRMAATTLVGADALKGVRQVVAGELGAIFPADGPLTDDQRKAVAALFGKLAAILGEF